MSAALAATKGSFMPPPPVRKRPHRITLDVDTDQYDWLSRQRFADHLSTSDRVRALLALSREDPDLNRRVVAKASELARAWADQE